QQPPPPLTSSAGMPPRTHLSFFLTRYGDPPDLHSFPTRRSSDLHMLRLRIVDRDHRQLQSAVFGHGFQPDDARRRLLRAPFHAGDRKSTRLNSSHVKISYAVFCLKKKKKHETAVRVTRDRISAGC